MEDRMRQQSLYLIVALEGRIFFFLMKERQYLLQQ